MILPILALNTRTPPLSEMMTLAESQKFVFVSMSPTGKSHVIVFRCNPLRSAACKKCAANADVDTGVCPVNLFGNRTHAGVPRNLREPFKRHGCENSFDFSLRRCDNSFAHDFLTISGYQYTRSLSMERADLFSKYRAGAVRYTSARTLRTGHPRCKQVIVRLYTYPSSCI